MPNVNIIHVNTFDNKNKIKDNGAGHFKRGRAGG